MRKGMWGLALLVSLAPSVVWAQRVSTFLGGVNPVQIINKPVDLSNSVAPVTLPTGRFWNFASFLPKFSLPGYSATPSISPLPPVSSFPSSHYPNTFQPLMPIKQLTP
jgi:hypothetical protein